MAKIFICKPYPKHILEKFPLDITHLIHKFSFGILLVEHIEPDKRLASQHHKEEILFRII
ncbi:MAG: hypothetical protein Q8L29_00765 [archaeon]|nr:hypothetical protein [archaeon]